MTEMGVIGLDLSLTAPGLSVAGRAETLRTNEKGGDRRLCEILDWVDHYIATRVLRLAVIEDVPGGPGAGAGGSLDRVHGVVRERLARYGIPFAYVNLTALKAFAAGNGRAEKSEVMDYVEQQTGQRPGDDNQADAWVLRRMGELFLLMDVEQYAVLPAAQAKALSSVDWPLFPLNPNWPAPYGRVGRQRRANKKCGHGHICLKNGDHWLHPFNITICNKPPKK